MNILDRSARELSVRDSDYEPIDITVFSRIKCSHHIVAKLLSCFYLCFSFFIKHVTRHNNDNGYNIRDNNFLFKIIIFNYNR